MDHFNFLHDTFDHLAFYGVSGQTATGLQQLENAEQPQPSTDYFPPTNHGVYHQKSLTQPMSALHEAQLGQQSYLSAHNVENDDLPFYPESDSGQFSGHTSNAEAGPSKLQNPNNYTLGYRPGGQPEPHSMTGSSQVPSQRYNTLSQSLPVTSHAESFCAATELAQESEGRFEAKALPVVEFAGFIDNMVGGQVARNALTLRKCQTVDDLNQHLDEIVAQTPPDAPASIREEVKKTRDSAKTWANQLRTQYPDKIVQSISFSDLKEKHYPQLGVDCCEPITIFLAYTKIIKLISGKLESQKPRKAVDSEKLNSMGRGKSEGKVSANGRAPKQKQKARMANAEAATKKQGFSVDDFLVDFSNSNHLIRKIEETNDSSADEGEPFARLIIDLFLSEMTGYLFKMGLGVFKIPEFRVAFDPIALTNGLFLTVLTGSVDYGLISKTTFQDCSMAALKNFWEKGKADGVQVFLRRARAAKIQFFLIEAKKKKYSKSLAEYCMPQVAGECITTMKLTGETAMRWCLSTGTTWVFGVVCREKWAGGEFRIYRINPMTYNIDALNHPPEVSVVHNIFWTLVCWTLVPVDNIMETLFKTT